MISNCLTHGIEAPAIRLEKGKTEKGSITFFLDSQGRLGMRDDGQGIVWRVLRSKAEEMGLLGLNESELVELLFSHGFSTKKSVDLSSGRGVGLDAVRESLREIGSDLTIVPLQSSESHLEFYFAIDLELKAKEGSLDTAS
jgi:chemotaxis protein histidine kinase CheA